LPSVAAAPAKLAAQSVSRVDLGSV
jgi:hypothetical protein